MKELLLKSAKEARLRAYAPYSNFLVGASLITKTGKVYTGCNIENASFGLCNCAERTCLFSAYADGVRKEDIKGFLIIGQTNKPISPCGACRQVMVELLPKDCMIYLTNLNNDCMETNIEQLMPYSFDKIEV